MAPRGMSELVRCHELDRAVTQVRLEEGVPEDHDCRRADARRLRVDVPSLAADRVDPNLRVRHSLSLLQPLDHGSYPRIANRMRADRREQRPDDDEDRSDGDEQGRDDRPPATGESPRQRHHDREHDRNCRRAGEHPAPLAQHVTPVVLLRDPVAPVPPETGQADGQRREPDRPLGAVRALVSGAVARLELLHVSHPRPQTDCRPQVHRSRRAERRLGVDPEYRHPRADHVQKALGMLEQREARRGVAPPDVDSPVLQLGRERDESPELLAVERFVFGERHHRAGDLHRFAR